jgi:hypothetical protein
MFWSWRSVYSEILDIVLIKYCWVVLMNLCLWLGFSCLVTLNVETDLVTRTYFVKRRQKNDSIQNLNHHSYCLPHIPIEQWCSVSSDHSLLGMPLKSSNCGYNYRWDTAHRFVLLHINRNKSASESDLERPDSNPLHKNCFLNLFYLSHSYSDSVSIKSVCAFNNIMRKYDAKSPSEYLIFFLGWLSTTKTQPCFGHKRPSSGRDIWY